MDRSLVMLSTRSDTSSGFVNLYRCIVSQKRVEAFVVMKINPARILMGMGR